MKSLTKFLTEARVSIAETVPNKTRTFIQKMNKGKWLNDDSLLSRGYGWWVIGGYIKFTQLRDRLCMRIFNANVTDDILNIMGKYGVTKNDITYDEHDTLIKFNDNVDLDSIAKHFNEIVALTTK